MRNVVCDFYVKCNPPTATHHHKKIVKAGGFSKLADKPELVEAKSSLAALLSAYVPDKPISGPIWLRLDFNFGWLKSHSAKFRLTNHGYKTSKPDCSNLAKVVEDVMTRLGYWNDDSQIVNLTVTKCYSINPGIAVVVEEVE